MDQHDGSRGSGQAPAKDFLALTHGQEWVSFYESFDKLVQDHLSRSSELLRRAMSLPEVADREVAQVRAEMEGKLAAERERSHDVLTSLREEIAASHTHVATLAENVQGVASGLASLSSRVAEALAALDVTPAIASAPVTAPALDAPVRPAPALNGAANGSVDAVSEEYAPINLAEETTNEPEPQLDAVAAPAEEPTAESVNVVAEMQADAVIEPAESADAETNVDAELGLDLTALAEAETETAEKSPDAEAPVESGTGFLDGEPVGVGGDRPRPHWLSVTRIGSRP
ncbi:MAG: hypothetical protein QOF01_3257 [Thermomicrobiales bacterium]|jgi:hypothetical protein|nr:hypothetical protein [Thermomicrobiales bacterium]MEA2528374.1 hypothetical protein [Thermomicrobiales bacterium]MEA2596788.1 hypothetical protein [Thermomicrobiales bacterium]